MKIIIISERRGALAPEMRWEEASRDSLFSRSSGVIRAEHQVRIEWKELLVLVLSGIALEMSAWMDERGTPFGIWWGISRCPRVNEGKVTGPACALWPAVAKCQANSNLTLLLPGKGIPPFLQKFFRFRLLSWRADGWEMKIVSFPHFRNYHDIRSVTHERGNWDCLGRGQIPLYTIPF